MARPQGKGHWRYWRSKSPEVPPLTVRTVHEACKWARRTSGKVVAESHVDRQRTSGQPESPITGTVACSKGKGPCTKGDT